MTIEPNSIWYERWTGVPVEVSRVSRDDFVFYTCRDDAMTKFILLFDSRTQAHHPREVFLRIFTQEHPLMDKQGMAPESFVAEETGGRVMACETCDDTGLVIVRGSTGEHGDQCEQPCTDCDTWQIRRLASVAGYGHIERVGDRWNVPGIGRVNHTWLADALGREPVDEERVTTYVAIRSGIHPD